MVSSLTSCAQSFANERGDGWPALVQLVEFAINDSVSPLGSGYTPFYAYRGQHPRRPLTQPSPPASAGPLGDGEAAAHLMVRRRVTEEVWAPMPGPTQGPSLLSPRWMGPFKVLACPAPNTYRLQVASQ